MTFTEHKGIGRLNKTMAGKNQWSKNGIYDCPPGGMSIFSSVTSAVRMSKVTGGKKKVRKGVHRKAGGKEEESRYHGNNKTRASSTREK
jgi:hypothetical protein